MAVFLNRSHSVSVTFEKCLQVEQEKTGSDRESTSGVKFKCVDDVDAKRKALSSSYAGKQQ